MILADPEGSVLAELRQHRPVLKEEVGSWVVEGIGEDFLPPVADLERVAKAYAIPDGESLHTARELLKTSGILAGSSSGTLIAALCAIAASRRRPSASSPSSATAATSTYRRCSTTSG